MFIHGKYKYEILDNYGYPLNKSELRKISINNLLNKTINKKIIYSLIVNAREFDNITSFNYRKFENIVVFNGVKLYIESFEELEKLIDSFVKANNTEVFPKYIK